MAKTTQEDLKKVIGGMKEGLQRIKKETGIWVKKGEVELSRLSRIGKLELDIVNLNIKKDKLFKDIGKRVVDLGLCDEIGDPGIKNMCKETKSVLNQSTKKRSEITKTGKRLFKSRPTQQKKNK